MNLSCDGQLLAKLHSRRQRLDTPTGDEPGSPTSANCSLRTENTDPFPPLAAASGCDGVRTSVIAGQVQVKPSRRTSTIDADSSTVSLPRKVSFSMAKPE